MSRFVFSQASYFSSQDFKILYLDSTQESKILDEEKTNLEHAQEPRTRPGIYSGVLNILIKNLFKLPPFLILMTNKFKLISPFKPAGSQPQAIKELVEGIKMAKNPQTLLGVTGSGKTFSIAQVIAQVQKPTLIIAHNKTLAAQLFREFKEFFPENRVEYFISFYDYYQPESYIPQKDQY